jgi:hypothetical protein
MVSFRHAAAGPLLETPGENGNAGFCHNAPQAIRSVETTRELDSSQHKAHTASITGQGSALRRPWLRDQFCSRLQQEGSAAMAEHRSHHFLPLNVDSRDPGFSRRYFAWAKEAQLEMDEAVAATKKTIASSRELLTKLDRMLVDIRVPHWRWLKRRQDGPAAR